MEWWFTADEHYDHLRMIHLANRPYSTVEEMREAFIEKHNARVEPRDQVWHVGDMFWKTMNPVEAMQILSRLNGLHNYVFGNHEEFFDQYPAVLKKFQTVQTRKTLELGKGVCIVLDHFAGRVWNKSSHGSWQLYGHSHGKLAPDPKLPAFDVGVDPNGYAPVSLEQVKKYMESRCFPYLPDDAINCMNGGEPA